MKIIKNYLHNLAHRRITNLILNHICDSWNIKPPGRLLQLNQDDYDDDYQPTRKIKKI
jgi:hypothetical protein